MNALNQIAALIGMSLRGILQRLGNSLVIVVGIAGVVVILIPVLALYQGFQAILEADDQPDRAEVLSRDAAAERSPPCAMRSRAMPIWPSRSMGNRSTWHWRRSRTRSTKYCAS